MTRRISWPSALRRPTNRLRANHGQLHLEQLEVRNLLSASAVETLAFPASPPNDTYYSLQWDMAGGYGIDAQKAWQSGYTGLDKSRVYVGVVDEGIQYTHVDLVGRVGNPGESGKLATNGKDDDGNGKKDDAYGWDFYSNNNTVYDGGKAGKDDDHGTHVAGTIGANGNNGRGVAGIDWNVGLISAKFLGPNGGYTSGAVAGINYLVNLKRYEGVNIVAINASWGGGGYDQSLYNAIKYAGDYGILFVAAAGNSGVNVDAAAYYPASYNLDNVITVAAIDVNGNLASWSNYGANTVDIGAPGVSIASTVPSDKYAYYSGTSMAAPHVTGAIALYAAYNPLATAAEIKSALLSSAVPTSSLAGKTATGGRLNVYNFLQKGIVSAQAGGTTTVQIAAVFGPDGIQQRTGESDLAPDKASSGLIVEAGRRSGRQFTLSYSSTVAAPGAVAVGTTPAAVPFTPVANITTSLNRRVYYPVLPNEIGVAADCEEDDYYYANGADAVGMSNAPLSTPGSSQPLVQRQWSALVDAIFQESQGNDDQPQQGYVPTEEVTQTEASLRLGQILIAGAFAFSPACAWVSTEKGDQKRRRAGAPFA